MERMRDQGGVYGGGCFLISERQIERRKKLQNYNTMKALDSRRLIFYMQQPTRGWFSDSCQAEQHDDEQLSVKFAINGSKSEATYLL